ncbi:Small nuclear ribonucleoprotein Sm D3 [Symbiodinium microadriaticum]|uniref:Small nuclear ribonucleoprotein Sm D3 n=1 Tax=Symbiodinium microadriaticum TaxID=2951 RepID=A0A1Q9CSL2_SYMMI|nr:Small nuclear ribonucleoprotein Sm D3 [Symbiodinium microadriaticum]
MAGLGIPVKLLHEGIGHTVTCELKTGEMYRGHLMNCEDNMNAMLEGVTVTGRDGKVTNLEQVYLRGSQIRYFILPDMLRHAPMFKKKGRGAGRGVYGPGGKEVNGAERPDPAAYIPCELMQRVMQQLAALQRKKLLNVLGANEVLTNKTSNR